jgi:XTP/dITP diphosphohydrolase
VTPAAGQPLLDFLDDMRRLRRECPWKREQTHRSLARYLQEETAEALEAIDTGDDEHLREELGDLLLQVYFHAVIGEETGAFTIDDVARGISDKMHVRNPHVFGSDEARADGAGLTAAEVDRRWQAIKQREKPRSSPYDGLAPQLSALLLATKVLEREPEAAVQKDSDDLGDRLLALVAEAVDAGVDPEQALRDALRRAVSPGR